MAKKNARVKTVEIGISDTRKLEVYPLSLAAEKKVWDLVEELREYLEEQKDAHGSYEDIPIAGLVQKGIDIFIANVEIILECVTRKEEIEELMNEIDNTQLMDIAKVIYEENFDAVKKKMVTMFAKPKSLKENLKKTE